MSDELGLDLQSGAKPLHLERSQIYIGTCSWADANFVKEGRFYPRGVQSDPRGRLQYYSGIFPTVEVDATYHALQPWDRASKWVAWTPEQFVFNVKAFSLFTWHETDPRRLPTKIAALLPDEVKNLTSVGGAMLPEEIMTACWDYFTRFIDVFKAAGKLGHVLFQFPKGQPYTPELFAYLERWHPYLKRWSVGVEIRHRSWLDRGRREELMGFLRERGYAYVIPDMVQRAYLPPPEVAVTAPWSVIRFHGHNPAMVERRAPTNRVYDYSYSEEELRPWAATVKDLARQVDRIYLLFNNHYRGQSARNAREISLMLN